MRLAATQQHGTGACSIWAGAGAGRMLRQGRGRSRAHAPSGHTVRQRTLIRDARALPEPRPPSFARARPAPAPASGQPARCGESEIRRGVLREQVSWARPARPDAWGGEGARKGESGVDPGYTRKSRIHSAELGVDPVASNGSVY